jgi:hypothetical protein
MTFSDDLPVAVERFELVYSEPEGARRGLSGVAR